MKICLVRINAFGKKSGNSLFLSWGGGEMGFSKTVRILRRISLDKRGEIA